ncbi:unnamed protein product [Cuscuta campestris]|uniref:SHSP domain-containing protein n=2 Tax=Cuscuta sect. Cleistogrammica TaxID=1824901 RepID=A0A484MDB6_9ASTE|nr:hypothetical protein DM860_006756 [Cuscuta australis]VFQ86705.1 unnamed protein product [Cuscuta campestris]
MDLEFGMKVTIKNASYVSSYLNLQLSKNVKGHFFQSAETHNMLILTVHLKGYETKHIQIGINEDGTIMEMRCEKPVEVIVMVGGRLETKGTETWKLKKRFRIPEGVSLDDIEAMFAEDESLLTVSMPKRVEGIVGTLIEEIKEPYEIPESPLKEAEIVELRKETDNNHHDSLGGPSDPTRSDDLEAEGKEERFEDHPEMAKKPDDDDDQETKQSIVDVSLRGGMGSNGDEVKPKREHPESSSGINSAKHEEEKEDLPKTGEVHEEEKVLPKTGEVHEEEKVLPKTGEDHEEEHPLPTLEAGVEKREEEEDMGKEVREKSSVICAPIIVAGSALLFSLAFIVRYFRHANRTPKPRN